MVKTILNALLFQGLWFIAVQAHTLHAVIAMFIFVLIHCVWFLKAQELPLIAITVVAGFLIELISINSGALLFENTLSISLSGYSLQLPPIWLLTLWVGFACTLNHSLSWLLNSRIAITLLSFIGVPFSYIAGFSFSSSESLTSPWYLGYVFEAALWCCLLHSLASFKTIHQADPLKATESSTPAGKASSL